MKLRIVKGTLFYWVQIGRLIEGRPPLFWTDYPLFRTPHFLTYRGALRHLRRSKVELTTPPDPGPITVYEEEI